jgi:hypothetical protein
MTRRSPVPPSPAFEAIARRVQFRDRIAVVVEAPPEAIFQETTAWYQAPRRVDAAGYSRAGRSVTDGR